MKKYSFVIKKIQRAFIEIESEPEDTIGTVTNIIEDMSEDELDFGDPEYFLETIVREKEKTSEIVYRSKIS